MNSRFLVLIMLMCWHSVSAQAAPETDSTTAEASADSESEAIPSELISDEKRLLIQVDEFLNQNQPDRAESLLKELHRRQSDYPGLTEKFGLTTRQFVEQSIARGDYLQARIHLHQLTEKFPNHPVAQEFHQQFAKLSQEFLESANAAASQQQIREAVILLEQAAVIWPKTSNLSSSYRQSAGRFQRLHVGVVRLSDQTEKFPFSTIESQQANSLSHLSLFHLDRYRDGIPYYSSKLTDHWEPVNLGRDVHFTLRQFRGIDGKLTAFPASEIVSSLSGQLDSKDSGYNERIAACIDSVTIPSPRSFSIHLKRVPPRIEPLLSRSLLDVAENRNSYKQAPYGFPTVYLQDVAAPHSPEITSPLTSSHFRIPAEPDGKRSYAIAEVVEHFYPGSDAAFQALINGEVSMLPNPPAWVVHRIQSDNQLSAQFFVLPSSVPATHVLQINPRSRLMKSRALRLALASSINMQKILQEVVLRNADARLGRLTTAPFSSKYPGRNIQVTPRTFQPAVAKAMIQQANQEFDQQLPALTLLVTPDQVAVEAAQQIANSWKELGLTIHVVTASDNIPEQYDLVYRSLQMKEPLQEMWPFLSMNDNQQAADLETYPDWTQQELIDLDRISDQPRALDALRQLHQNLWRDVAFIPLWEIDHFVILRKNVQGFPQTFIHGYDKLDRWTIQPWYQTDLPLSH